MTHQASFIKTLDGVKLFSQVWMPQSEPSCVICLVHGIGEHSSRYDAWAKRFADENVAVVAFDQRGHGESGGVRGQIPSYNTLLDDIDLILHDCEKSFPEVPVVLYGHSLGGGEVLNHLLFKENKYKAVIATSPWLISQQSPPKFLMPLIHLLEIGFPNLCLKTKLNADLLSRDNKVVDDYKNDKLVHAWVSVRLFYQAYIAGYNALAHASLINKPLLLLHGSADQITSAEVSQQFVENAGKLCQFHVFQNAFHELHNDSCKDEVFDIILNWIQTKLINS